MELRSVTSAMIRRWWVVLLVLVVAVGAVVWIMSSPTERYEAAATLLLATPAVAGAGESEVPADDPEPRLDSSVVIEIVEGDATRARLSPELGTADYAVVAAGEGILRVETTAVSEESVVEAAMAVIGEIERTVTELDSDDPDRTADLTVLSSPSLPRQRDVVSGGEAEVEYFAVGSLLLEVEEVIKQQDNPYTASPGTIRVIQAVASTGSVLETVRDAVGDADADFELVFDSRDVAPILQVEASASTPESTMATLEAVLTFLDADLAERQALTGADKSTWLEFQPLAVTAEPTVIQDNRRRPIAIVIVLGLLISSSLAVLVDGLLTSPYVGRRIEVFVTRIRNDFEIIGPRLEKSVEIIRTQLKNVSEIIRTRFKNIVATVGTRLKNILRSVPPRQ